MKHEDLIKACKKAEASAKLEAQRAHPGHVQQLSGRYLVVDPFVPFGDCLWDNSMREFLRVMHRAQDKDASSMYIMGVVNVASENHRFAINHHIPYAATWCVDIDLTDDREPRMRDADLRTILWKTPQ